MTRFTSYRWAGAAAAALGLFAATVAGQPPRPAPPDPLEAAKATQRIAEQRAESEVLLQIQNADNLAKGNHTAKAVSTLKTAKQNLQFAPGIGEAARTRLTAMLDAKLAAVEGRPAANPNPGVLLDPKGTEVKAAKKEAVEKYFAEMKDVRDGLKKVEHYQANGKNREADAEIARLAKLYPHNPSVLVLGQKSSIQDRLADAQAHYAESSRRWVELQKQINKSSLPAIYDVEFPPDWKEKSERRLKATQVQMTAKEKKIIEALDKPTTINFAERPLDEALQDLSNLFDQPLLIDKKSLEDLGLDLKKGVTLQGKGLSGRTVLRSILATQGLTFVVKDESIQIMTVERARSTLSTRVYYLGDLIQAGPFSGPQWGPVLNGLQAADNAKLIVDTITKSIDPLSWSQNGGPGTVTFHFPSQSIIVRASTEVHHTLGRGFGR